MEWVQIKLIDQHKYYEQEESQLLPMIETHLFNSIGFIPRSKQLLKDNGSKSVGKYKTKHIYLAITSLSGHSDTW